MVEEDADQHLHHFTVEFKRKVMRQDQLREKNSFFFFLIVVMASSKEDF